jgi:hypothetical protein
VPIHIEEMTSEVAAVGGDLPLSEAQIERLVDLVCRRLEDRERLGRRRREATTLRRSATPSLELRE